jgi:phosphatidylserine/phosphatidylglycerophosphate/cardiolipin synthase-like enzyme
LRGNRLISNLLLLLICTFLSLNVSAARRPNIEVYFNNYNLESYTDPYRGVEKRGHNLEARIIERIDAAKTSIDIAIQELRLPLIAKALVRAKKRGVKVRVILENNYNNTVKEANSAPRGEDEEEHDNIRYIDLFALVDMNRDGVLQRKELQQRDAVYILRTNRVTVKDDTFDDSNGSGLMHHKFLVIDRRTLVVSSANFTMSGIHGDFMNENSTGNANAMIILDDTKLSSTFTAEFNIMWGSRSRDPQFGLAKPFRQRKQHKMKGSSITVQFSPTPSNRSWKESVNGLIYSKLAKAKYESLMALFVFSEQRFANVLNGRLINNPNFNLGILVERKFATRSYSELLDIWGLEILDENCEYEDYNQPWENPYLNVGTPIMNTSDVLHHKFAVIDDHTVIFGSQNWSLSANQRNDENLLVIEDREVARAFKEEYYRLEESSRMGPPNSVYRRIEKMREICSAQ